MAAAAETGGVAGKAGEGKATEGGKATGEGKEAEMVEVAAMVVRVIPVTAEPWER